MNQNKKLERAINIIFALIGLLCLIISGFTTEPPGTFWAALWMNLGSSFIAIALVFSVNLAVGAEDNNILPPDTNYPTVTGQPYYDSPNTSREPATERRKLMQKQKQYNGPNKQRRG